VHNYPKKPQDVNKKYIGHALCLISSTTFIRKTFISKKYSGSYSATNRDIFAAFHCECTKKKKEVVEFEVVTAVVEESYLLGNKVLQSVESQPEIFLYLALFWFLAWFILPLKRRLIFSELH
jgi:hypothetical protein